MKIIYIFLFLLYFSLSAFSTVKPDDYSDISRIELLIFGKTYPDLKESERLSKVEKPLFGKTFSLELPKDRIVRISDYLLGYYENTAAKEISLDEFEELFFRIVNNERSFKGLLPIFKDEIAIKVADEESLDLMKQGRASFFNSKKQGPDERYTLAGGTGALIEVIKGFELEPGKGHIKLNEILVKQLIEAISFSTDDSQILYSPHITHIGYGFALSQDKTKFISVLDFLTKGGDLEPVKSSISLSQKINVSGKLRKPYKFKAVSIGYLNDPDTLDFTNEHNGFDSENLKPYFPPQDFIAYADKAKINVIKVLQGIGFIGALGASPFTGGATSFLAPVFLNSLQSGPPREIPLKGGMKSNPDGSFYGNLELNYQGMAGLYYVSVISELPGSNSSIVVSRRTVRVGSPL